jgi:hypothetical protein
MRNAYKFTPPTENLKGRDHSEDLDIHRRILEWILEKQGSKLWIGIIWIRTGTSGGLS